jgi:hypothetical protein
MFIINNHFSIYCFLSIYLSHINKCFKKQTLIINVFLKTFIPNIKLNLLLRVFITVKIINQ